MSSVPRYDWRAWTQNAADGVVALCAALAAQDTGSARQALNLLYKAGELARSKDAAKIVEEHVYAARTAVEQRQIEQGMCELTRHGHLALVAALELALAEDTPARVRDVYPRYQAIAEASQVDPLVRRRMHDHLADLAMLGILDRHARNQGRAGGQYYEYEFSVDLSTVCEVVTELEGIRISDRLGTYL